MLHALFHVRPSFPLFHGLTFTREIALSNDPFVPSLRRCSRLSFFSFFFFFFLVFLRDSPAATATFSKVRVRLAFRDWKKKRLLEGIKHGQKEKGKKRERLPVVRLFLIFNI